MGTTKVAGMGCFHSQPSVGHCMIEFFRARAGVESGKICLTVDPFLLLKLECAAQASNEKRPDFQASGKRRTFRQNPNSKFGNFHRLISSTQSLRRPWTKQHKADSVRKKAVDFDEWSQIVFSFQRKPFDPQRRSWKCRGNFEN